ncbi:hypothetical protein MRX96_004632 [Rhipicephalus microplus]
MTAAERLLRCRSVFPSQCRRCHSSILVIVGERLQHHRISVPVVLAGFCYLLAFCASGEPDGLQESKRQAREASGGHPIVWGPVKVPPGQEDEVAKRVQNAMGDFDTAQWLFTHHRDQLFGIAGTSAAAQNRTPPTVSSPVGNGSAPTARNVNATGGY